MSDQWDKRTIRQCLSASFAGEWGDEPAPGNVLVLRATDIDDDAHVVGVGAERRLPASKLSAKQLADGDILLEGSGGGPDKPVGRVAFFDARQHPGPAVCSNFFKTLRPNRNVVDPRFLLRKLAWFYKQPALLAFQQQTTGIINLKFEEYLSTPIEIPSELHEQRLISQVLDTLDTAIRETEAIIAKLKAVKQGLLHDLLTRGIDANGELRPPQAEAPHLYKQSPLGWIPKEWRCAQIRELGEVVTGGTPPTSDNKAWGDGLPFVTPGDLTDEGLDGVVERQVSPHGLRYIRQLPPGTTLVVCIGSTIGKVGFASFKCCTNQQINAVIPGSDANPKFMHLALEKCTAQMRGLAGLQAVPIVNKSSFEKIPIPAPLKGEQVEISLRVRALIDRLRRESGYVDSLSAMKIGLMDDLLTGHVRVTPLLSAGQQAQTRSV